MLTLLQLAPALGAELRIPADHQRSTESHADATEIAGVSSIAGATGRSIVFAEDGASLAGALASEAAAVLVTEALADTLKTVPRSKPLLLHSQPRMAFARASELLAEKKKPTGIHSTAVIAASAILGEGLSIGAYVVIEEEAAIGQGSMVGIGAVIGAGVRIGCDCRIYPRVVLYRGVTLGKRVVVHAGAVLGADGFGYVRDAVSGEYMQFPQQGTLVIEDNVEIGANSTIDRGSLEETRISSGTKIDNLVHIGHNVSVGRNVVIASQTGISGSTRVGDGAIFGGQVGIGDHAEVGAGVILGGQAGVLPHKSLQGPGQLFWGTPAKPVKTYLRELATLARLVRRTRVKE